MKKGIIKVISVFLAITVFVTVIPIVSMATDELKVIKTVDCFGGMSEACNKLNGTLVGTCTRSTNIEGYVSDYNGNVKRLQTAQGVKRALVIEGKSYDSKFNIPIKPEMELHIDYKYVPAQNTTTDTAALLTKKPGIIISNPSVNGGAIIEAEETLISGEWATAVFKIGKYFDISNENYIKGFRYAPLSFSGSGTATGVTLDIEKQTAINVDSNDYVDIGNIYIKIKTHTVSFDLNGGKSDGSTSVADVVYDGNIEYPEAPEKEGYVFKGWSLSAASNATIDEKIWAPTSNCTLYAQYSEKNIIDLKSIDASNAVMALLADGNGVKGGTYSKVTEDSFTCLKITSNEDSKVVIATDCWEFGNRMPLPIKSGMRLAITYKYIKGAGSDSSSKITEQNPAIRVMSNNSNVIITASEKVVIGEWTKVYFDLSEIASEVMDVIIRQIHIMPLGTAASGAAEGTQLYSTALESVHIDAEDSLFLGDVTLALKYDYKLTFDGNGGGSGDRYEYITVAGGGAKFDGQKPIRVGYKFMGWATSPTAAENDILEVGYMPTADATLYAVWKEDTSSTLDALAVVYPLSGERSTLTGGQKLFADAAATVNDTLPNYLLGKEFNLDSASTQTKTIWIIDEGYVYIMTTKKGLEGSDAKNLEELGFDAIGESELVNGTVYSIYGKFYESQGTADSKINIGANTVVIADLVYPDDSLKAPTIIKNIEENLEQYPEYSEFLDGNRKFGGCPSITQTKDGTVWLSITSGGTGEDMYNYAALYKSTDGGKTFGEFVLVANPDTPVRTSEPYVWCAPDGELFFWWSQMFVVPGGGNSDGRMGIFMMRSSDNGKTWTQPKRICDGFANQNPIVLKDGSYALPVNIWNNNGKYSELNNKKCPTLYISNDKGENWIYAGGAKDSNSGCSDSWFYENSVIEYDDGTLAMYYRTIGGKVGVITSTNGGETWSAEIDSEISYTSARTASIRLKDGTTIFISHNEELAQGARKYLSVWIGEFDKEKGIYTKNDEYMLELDVVGWYPSVYEGNDGFLYVTYDRARGSGGCAMVAKITVDDIKAGKLVSEGSFLKRLAFKGDCEGLPSATLSFETNGGEEIDSMTFRTKNDDFNTPYEVRVLPKAVKQDIAFLGWSTVQYGEVEYQAGDNYTPTAMKETLYAIFDEKQPITKNYYVKNGGTGYGTSVTNPAATVRDVLNTIVKVDKLGAGDIANIYIMQRDDWDTVDLDNGICNYMTAWSVSGEKILTAHDCEIVVQAYDNTKTTYLAFVENAYVQQDLVLAGPTTFKNITLVSCISEFSGVVANGNNLTYDVGTELSRMQSKGDVVIETKFPGRILALDNNGIGGTNNTYIKPQKIIFENERGGYTTRSLYISGNGATKTTYKEDVTLIFNNSKLSREIYWGANRDDGAAVTFEKNLNVDIKSAEKLTNSMGKIELNINGAFQYIINSNVQVTNDISTITNINAKGGKWIITNQTSINDLFDFTATAGEFKIKSEFGIVAVSSNGAVYSPDAKGILKMPAGVYTVKQATVGDPNANGEVNICDLVMVDELIASGITYFPSADIDGNGKVELADIAKLKKQLLGVK